MTTSTQNSLRNHFLVSMPGLDDALFAHSVTYLCEHTEQGAMGLIVNHPMDITLADIFEDMGLDYQPRLTFPPVLAGGPVETNRGFVLHRNDGQQWQSSLAITPSLQLTTSSDILAAIARGEGPQDVLITLGYAGWAPNQLEEEIAANAWLTLPADEAILFDTPFEQRIHAAEQQLGVDLNLIGPLGHA